MLLAELCSLSARVGATRKRTEKIAALGDWLRLLGPEEIAVGVPFVAGELRQGRIGVGWALVRDRMEAAGPAAAAPTLSLLDVDRALGEIAATSGSGSAARRRDLLGALFAAATTEERELLARLLLGELRQGALEGILVEAVARAASVEAAALRRAAMLAGVLAPVAEAALREGAAGLGRFRLQLLRPVQPMLAQPTEGLDEALAEADGQVALEWKLDGARVQVHKDGDEVRVFSRALAEVPAVPEVVDAVRALPARSLILDGEAIALLPSGRPRPFQETMRRFSRDADDAALREAMPLRPFFFDLLHKDGEDLLDHPMRERALALRGALGEALVVPRLVAPAPAEALAFLDDALGRGHEGVMVKTLDAPYEAGRRGGAWKKVKRAHTLDLVVLAVERGSGRRRGFLSNIHLGARDPERGGFVMLGKTFKGMTDEMLAWQTQHLRALAVSPEATDDGSHAGYVVHVRPELVAEIAFDGLQQSPHYPGGLALRFARVKRYRPDKRAEDASTLDEVRAIFAAQSPGEGDEPDGPDVG